MCIITALKSQFNKFGITAFAMIIFVFKCFYLTICLSYGIKPSEVAGGVWNLKRFYSCFFEFFFWNYRSAENNFIEINVLNYLELDGSDKYPNVFICCLVRGN